MKFILRSILPLLLLTLLSNNSFSQRPTSITVQSTIDNGEDFLKVKVVPNTLKLTIELIRGDSHPIQNISLIGITRYYFDKLSGKVILQNKEPYIVDLANSRLSIGIYLLKVGKYNNYKLTVY